MSGPSTRRPDLLPSPLALERLCRSLALLDAIVSPDDWDRRYHSFDAHWNEPRCQRLGSTRDGSGDELLVLFQPEGAILKGWAHEYPSARPGHPPSDVFHGLPQAFEGFLSEPAFSVENTTFCMWNTDGHWKLGSSGSLRDVALDGSESLLRLLPLDAVEYQSWAQHYWERPIDLTAVRRIFSHDSLDAELLASMNSHATYELLSEEIAQIGYPMV